MGHNLEQKPYSDLIDRLNQYQVGAPQTSEIYEILKILYTKEEAFVGSKFPLGRATIKELVRRTGIAGPRLEQIIEEMAQKGVVIDFTPGDTRFFILAPTIFGFFEFSFMRLNSDLPLKHLAELMDKTLQNEMKREFFGSKTQMSRVLIYEKNLPTSQVMSYEQVSALIRKSIHLSLQPCFCRHKAQHMGKECDTPLEVCMGLGITADFLVRRGFARQVSQKEMLEVLDQTEKLGLVHITDNVRDDPYFICHCCRCCCELLRGVNEFNIKYAVSPNRFVVCIDERECIKCGVCAHKCPLMAISVEYLPEDKKIVIDKERCLGCSVCVNACDQGALSMTERSKTPPVPKNYLTRHLKIAREKGRVKHFIFYAVSKILRGEISDVGGLE